MKHSNFRQKLGLACLAAMIICPAAFAAKKPDIKITKVFCESVKTPMYKGAEESVKYHWGRFGVKFDVKDSGTKDDWIDTLDVTWKIIATDASTNKVKLYTLTVTYEDVEKGTGHNVCIYLKPKFMQRFTNSKLFNKGDFSSYVEISVNGQRVASEEDLKPKHNGLPKNWHKQEADATRSERYLLPKSKTPFAGFDYDFYENERVSSSAADISAE